MGDKKKIKIKKNMFINNTEQTDWLHTMKLHC